tara:strand:+ start:6123 stop:7118 length:996 start_codon:yes stop_codon:yes gene_type:complete
MTVVEDKFVRQLSTRLLKFKNIRPGVYNFRCPYCGDSQKHTNKARGYFFAVKNEYVYKCHNCGKGVGLANFLKDNASDLYDEFLMEKYRNNQTGKGRRTANPKIPSATPYFAKKVTDLTPINELNKGHPARDYLESRKIPEHCLEDLYYVDKFKRWVNTQRHTFDNLQNDRPRIIIPLKDKDGKWFGVQGRSLSPKSNLRYITILFDDAAPKLYGLDKIREGAPVYVTEGPFDSLFIPQAIAMCGADVDPRRWGISNPIWVYDNEPRNKQITDRIKRAIDSNDPVVIWPKGLRQKDINDMILAGIDVYSIIKQNTHQGISARIKFSEWKKV